VSFRISLCFDFPPASKCFSLTVVSVRDVIFDLPVRETQPVEDRTDMSGNVAVSYHIRALLRQIYASRFRVTFTVRAYFLALHTVGCPIESY
jgi:hypothetical protein